MRISRFTFIIFFFLIIASASQCSRVPPKTVKNTVEYVIKVAKGINISQKANYTTTIYTANREVNSEVKVIISKWAEDEAPKRLRNLWLAFGAFLQVQPSNQSNDFYFSQFLKENKNQFPDFYYNASKQELVFSTIPDIELGGMTDIEVDRIDIVIPIQEALSSIPENEEEREFDVFLKGEDPKETPPTDTTVTTPSDTHVIVEQKKEPVKSQMQKALDSVLARHPKAPRRGSSNDPCGCIEVQNSAGTWLKVALYKNGKLWKINTDPWDNPTVTQVDYDWVDNNFDGKPDPIKN